MTDFDHNTHMLVTMLRHNTGTWAEIGDSETWKDRLTELLKRQGGGCHFTHKRYPSVILICAQVHLSPSEIDYIFSDAANQPKLRGKYTHHDILPPLHVWYTAAELFEEITEHFKIPAVATAS